VASHPISGQRWPDGTSVSVYLAAAYVNPPAAPSGTPVTTAAVLSGTVTFTGLTAGLRYVAYAAGVGVRFLVQPGSVDTLRPITGPEAQEIREGLGQLEQFDATELVNVAGGLRGEVVPQVSPGVWGPAGRTLAAAGRTWLLRFSPTRAWDVSLARWDVTVAASADDATEAAVYTADLGARLASSGVQSGQFNATGIKGVPLVQSFDPAQVYYVAWKAPVALGGTGATVNGRTCAGVSTTLFGSAVPTALAGFVDGLSSPLPAAITPASVNWTALNVFPLLALREV
jgi:hypothetical protein